MNIAERIADHLGEMRKFGARRPKYLILSPPSRSKLLRIARHDTSLAVETDPKDGTMKFLGLQIAVIENKPEPYMDIV